MKLFLPGTIGQSLKNPEKSERKVLCLKRKSRAYLPLFLLTLILCGSFSRVEGYDFHLIPASNLSYGFRDASSVPAQDSCTGAEEIVSTSSMGIAMVHSVESRVSGSLRLSGAVRADNVNYYVVSFGQRCFRAVRASKVTLDLTSSANKKRVIFYPICFAGAKKLETLSLKASTASLFGFRKNVFQGSKITRIAVYGMDGEEFKKMERKLRNCGYRGKIVRKG